MSKSSPCGMCERIYRYYDMCYTSSWCRDGMCVKCSLMLCLKTWFPSITSVPFSFQLIPADFNPCAYRCTTGQFSTTSSCVFGFQSWTALCDYVCWDPCLVTLCFSHILFSSYHTSMTYLKRVFALTAWDMYKWRSESAPSGWVSSRWVVLKVHT